MPISEEKLKSLVSEMFCVEKRRLKKDLIDEHFVLFGLPSQKRVWGVFEKHFGNKGASKFCEEFSKVNWEGLIRGPHENSEWSDLFHVSPLTLLQGIEKVCKLSRAWLARVI